MPAQISRGSCNYKGEFPICHSEVAGKQQWLNLQLLLNPHFEKMGILLRLRWRPSDSYFHKIPYLHGTLVWYLVVTMKIINNHDLFYQDRNSHYWKENSCRQAWTVTDFYCQDKMFSATAIHIFITEDIVGFEDDNSYIYFNLSSLSQVFNTVVCYTAFLDIKHSRYTPQTTS